MSVAANGIGGVFAWSAGLSFLLWGTLLVVFGEVTVRRLRKDPEVRRQMGFELLPGWDIVNVAVALSWPRRIMRWFDARAVLGVHANSETMYRHTSGPERFLARAFYWSLVFSCVSLALFGLVDKQSG